jgi:LmbE family N-acetylglucosaminyl deacetylase
VAPHADDEVLGAGGAMALAAESGWEVRVCYAVLSGYTSLARGDTASTRERRAEAEAALSVLGAKDYEVWFEGESHHLRLDTVPQADLIQLVERAIGTVEPEVVLVPALQHFHQDHRAVARACHAALRPGPSGSRPLVKAVLRYGHPAPQWGDAASAFAPNVFLDLELVLQKKLTAMQCYRSQLCPPPHPRSLEALRDSSAWWGSLAGVRYAEPFECARLIVA